MINATTEISHNKIIRFQRLSCTALIAIMLVSSLLGSFFRVPFDDDFSVFYETVDQEEDTKEEPYLSFDFLGSTVSIVKAISLYNSSYSERQEAYYGVLESDRLSLSARSSGIAYLVLEAFDLDFTVGVYYVFLLTVSIGTPIFLLILLIIILKKYFKPQFRKTEHAIYKGTLNMFRIAISRVPLILLLTVFVPKTKFGSASFAILTLCFLGILMNAFSSHLKNYTKAQRKYRTMLQLTSLVGILIFVCFCITLRGSNLIPKAISLFDGQNLADLVSIFEGGNFDMDEILSLLAGFVLFFALFGMTKPLANNFCRIGITTTRMKEHCDSFGDSYIASSIRPNVAILVFFLLLGSKSELIFYKGEVANLVISLISIVGMTLVEIAVHVLRETLCIDLGRGGMDAVLEGTTYEAQSEDNLVAEAKTQLEKKRNDEKNAAEL